MKVAAAIAGAGFSEGPEIGGVHGDDVVAVGKVISGDDSSCLSAQVDSAIFCSEGGASVGCASNVVGVRSCRVDLKLIAESAFGKESLKNAERSGGSADISHADEEHTCLFHVRDRARWARQSITLNSVFC